MSEPLFGKAFGRRRLIQGAGLVALAPAITACGKSTKTGASADQLAYWDMPWGPAEYTKRAQALVKSYKPAVRYQSIPWANYLETYTSALTSKTGPAASTGAGGQPFYFAKQGAIAPADNVIATMQKNGDADFLPGILDKMKYEGSYVAIPWMMDVRALYYRKSLLEKADAEPPTDWDSLRATCAALKKKTKTYGFGMACGTGTHGWHAVLAVILNNDGALFTEDGQPNCITERNIEAVDFLLDLAKAGYMDKAAVGYSNDNVNSDFVSGHVSMVYNQPSMRSYFPTSKKDDVLVTSPLVGPHGDKGALMGVGPLMMYKNTPDQEATEKFVLWYLNQMKVYWSEGLVSTLPVRKSFLEMPQIQNDPTSVSIINEWQPVAKSLAARSRQIFPEYNAIDGGVDLQRFTQGIVQAQLNAKTLLTNLQKGLEKIIPPK